MRKPWMLLAGIALILVGLGGLAVLNAYGPGVGYYGGPTALPSPYSSLPPSSYVPTGAPPRYYGGFGLMMGQSYGMMGRDVGGPGMMGRFARVPRPGAFASTGEALYFTGIGADGGRMQPSLPMAAMMGLSCADCHGTDRRGGIVMPDGRTKAADISARALASWSDEQVSRAITSGIDEKGGQLSPWMPSWGMPPGDLKDLIGYLKSSP